MIRVLKSIAWAPAYALGGILICLAITCVFWTAVATLLMIAGAMVLENPLQWAQWWANEPARLIIVWAMRIGAGAGFIAGPFFQYSEYKEDPNAPKTLREFCAQSIAARKKKQERRT